MSRLLLFLRSLFSPVRLLDVRSPHDGLVVLSPGAGGAAPLVVKARGYGRLGRGENAVVVNGVFEGVVFAVVDVDVQSGRAVCVLHVSGLFGRKRTLPVRIVPLPRLPEAPVPTSAPAVALPSFVVSLEVP